MIQTAGARRFDRHRFGMDGRRNAILLIASVAFHGLVLAPLALRWIADDAPPLAEQPQPLWLQIEPRPRVRGERPRPRPVTSPATTSPPVGRDTPGIVQAPIVRTPEDDEDDATSQSTISSLSTISRPDISTLSTPRVDGWQVRPDDTAGRVARSLRNGAVGCRMIETLTATERAACNQAFGQAASQAPPIEGTGNAGRDSRFAREGAAALARYDARRAPVPGGTGVSGATGVGVTGISGDCAGGNLRGNCPGELLRDGFRHEEDQIRQPRLPN